MNPPNATNTTKPHNNNNNNNNNNNTLTLTHLPPAPLNLLHTQSTCILQNTLSKPPSLHASLTVSSTRLFSAAAQPQHTSDPPPPPSTTTTTSRDDTHAATKTQEEEEDLSITGNMTPRQVVDHLDRYIIGQNEAKKAVAIAMRNRWRRHRVPTPLKSEIVPKNILMIGPTGCGKTEIARRLAKIADAPFVKVEASKYTELGYVGRDVDGIIRDLVDNAVNIVKQRHRQRQQGVIDRAVEKTIIDALCTPNGDERTRGSFLQLLRDGKLEDRLIEIEISSGRGGTGTGGRYPPPQLGPNIDNNSPTTNRNEFMSDISAMVQSLSFTSREKQTKKLPVADARSILAEREAEKLMNQDMIIRQALKAAAEDGIVFIDEIDKIVSPSDSWRKSADASAEGVQRDLLPIIEGSVVNTRYGPLNTDHILFICGGAFHSSKPSDLMAELQGRLPIRVELKGLTKDEFYRILTEPENNLIKQNTALLETENVHLIFTDAAVNEIALVAEEVNINVENIGARRLHTIMEKILEEVSYSAAEKGATPDAPVNVVIDKEDVIGALAAFREKQDLSRYIL